MTRSLWCIVCEDENKSGIPGMCAKCAAFPSLAAAFGSEESPEAAVSLCNSTVPYPISLTSG
jgi:hypothetical protein